MPKLPGIKGKDLVKALIKQGFLLDRIHGSHHILRAPDGRKTTVAVHGNQEIPKGTIGGIMDDLDISRDELLGLLKKK